MVPQMSSRITDAHVPGVARPAGCVRCPDVYADPADWCEPCRWSHAMEFARLASRAERAAELEAIVGEFYRGGGAT